MRSGDSSKVLGSNGSEPATCTRQRWTKSRRRIAFDYCDLKEAFFSHSSPTNSALNCRRSGEFASREASVRPIPSASAMWVMVAPEASALAIRAKGLRSSAVGLKCASSAIGVLRLLTRANRRDEFALCAQFPCQRTEPKPAAHAVWDLYGHMQAVTGFESCKYLRPYRPK